MLKLQSASLLARRIQIQLKHRSRPNETSIRHFKPDNVNLKLLSAALKLTSAKVKLPSAGLRKAVDID